LEHSMEVFCPETTCTIKSASIIIKVQKGLSSGKRSEMSAEAIMFQKIAAAMVQDKGDGKNSKTHEPEYYGKVSPYRLLMITFMYFIYLPLMLAYSGLWYILFLWNWIPVNLNFFLALSDFSIIITLFFYTFMLQTWSYYSSGPVMYRELLNKILEFASAFFALVNAEESYLSWMNQQIESSGKIIQSKRLKYTEVKEYTREEFHVETREIHVERCLQTTKDQVYDLLKHCIHQTHAVFLPHHPPTYYSKLLEANPEGNGSHLNNMVVAHWHIVARIKILEKFNCIQVADGNLLNHALDPLKTAMTNLEVSNNTPTLPYMYYHVLVCIIIYFGLFVPYRIVISAGVYIFVFYPLVLYALFGMFVIRQLVGSPFRSSIFFTLINFRKWRDEAEAMLQAHYERKVTIVQMGLESRDLEAIKDISAEAKPPLPLPMIESSASAGKFSEFDLYS